MARIKTSKWDGRRELISKTPDFIVVLEKLPAQVGQQHLFYLQLPWSGSYHKQHYTENIIFQVPDVPLILVVWIHKYNTNANIYLITCIPSRISTFLGTAEDLMRGKHRSLRLNKWVWQSNLWKEMFITINYILLTHGTISKLSILSMTPTYAGIISTNKMVHVTRIHAT